jgi:hypothetical protein
VNAGSAEISVFCALDSRLALSDKVPSEESEPNAIAQHEDLVYGLNTGGNSNVTGFILQADHRRYIKNSRAFLSTSTSGAASVAFSPDGNFIAVTERPEWIGHFFRCDSCRRHSQQKARVSRRFAQRIAGMQLRRAAALSMFQMPAPPSSRGSQSLRAERFPRFQGR